MTIQNDVERSNKTKYIEEKARKIMQIVYDCTNKPHESYEANYNFRMTEYKSFIRTIVSDVRRLNSDKPKIKAEEVYAYVDKEWKNYTDSSPESYDVKAMILDFLEKIGVEVTE